MIVELPVPLENGATHAHIELVNYKLGYAVYGVGTAVSEFSNTRSSKVIPGMSLDSATSVLIAQSVSGVSAETVIEPEPQPEP